MNITEFKSPRDIARLRRIALNAQGLLQAQPFGRGLAGARNAINHIGYVQIDTISVVERAHNHIFSSRVPGFTPAMTNTMLAERDIFEYWTHAAAFIPIKDFRFSLPYKHAIKCGQVHWYKTRDKKLMAELLQRIHTDGPLRSRDLEASKNKRAGWWDWKPAKKALEQLYMEGELMVSNRDGFQKAYDLTERVLPSDINTTMPDINEFAEHLLDQQLRCHGLVSVKGVSYLRRNTELRKTIKALIDARLDQRLLQAIKMPDGELFYIEKDALEHPLPRQNKRLRILSPFDNSVIQRDRLRSLFSFDYQIECYVPAAKRQYGYFCLPLLYRSEFIGRIDCKAHRKTAELEIKALYLDGHLFEAHRFDKDEVLSAFIDAITDFCRFQQCHSVSLTSAFGSSVSAPHIRQHLQQHLRQHLHKQLKAIAIN